MSLRTARETWVVSCDVSVWRFGGRASHLEEGFGPFGVSADLGVFEEGLFREREGPFRPLRVREVREVERDGVDDEGLVPL